MPGTLSKMHSTLSDTVQYSLPVGQDLIPLNGLLGQTLQLKHTGQIFCAACGRKTKKSYSQGFCFPCMKSLARCDMCILKPETCHFDAGTCREPDWGRENCMITHKVYVANTSGLKVGITRHTQTPTRWIDQGATQALPLFEVDTRKLSGLVEVALGGYMSDKTDWRKMLKGDAEALDLAARAEDVLPLVKERLADIRTEAGEEAIRQLAETTVEIRYPVLEYPTKITSHNFDKNPLVEGTLQGIKGQYLLFDTGVINIRKFTSYEVAVNC